VLDRSAHAAGSVLVALATAVIIVALAVLPFLNPAWVAFEQGRAHATAWTGYTAAELRTATDALLADLVLGPPTFDAEVAGEPVLSMRERQHLVDVRSVMTALAVAALASLAIVVVAWRLSRSAPAFWRAVRWGSAALVVGTVLVGIVGLVAFDVAFEAFHRLFFAGGTYTFDPRTERLVQLFPQRFWFETSLAVGAVILLLSVVVGWLAARKLGGRTSGSIATAPSLQTAP
jgi:integral membrane protein (TIGR01906 family)